MPQITSSNVGGVEPVARLQRPEHRGGEVLGVHVGQGAFAHLADAAGRAHRIDDEGFGHCASLRTSRASFAPRCITHLITLKHARQNHGRASRGADYAWAMAQPTLDARL